MKVQRTLLFLIVVVLVIIAMTPVVSAATPAQIEASVSKGITYLASTQSADGSWGGYAYTAHTGMAVLKLEDRAIEQGKSPFDPTYPYHSNVENGLNYLFTRVQADGGITDSYQVYDTSIAIMAICESGTPNKVVSGTGNPNADGKTYKQIAEAAVHRLQESQSVNDGGWYYNTNEDDEATPGYGDQSNTGYATLALVYAQKFGISDATILPGLNYWVNHIQSGDGSSMYEIGYPWPNVYKTGSLLSQFKMVGIGSGDPRVQNAITYIQNHWNDNGLYSWDQGWLNSYQSCFGLMKGFESQGITTISVGSNPSLDWFDEMSDWIVGSQNADGSWPSDTWADSHMSTCWAMLTLEKTIEVPPASFDVVKSADESTITSGGAVTYTYLVSNTGLYAISNILLTDDKLGVISGPASGDTNSNGQLDSFETWTYSKTTNLISTTSNTATANGKDPTGVPVSINSNAVTVKVEGGGIPSPEFPSVFLPAAMIIGFLGAVLFIQRTREH
jgi:hypothetical protein